MKWTPEAYLMPLGSALIDQADVSTGSLIIHVPLRCSIQPVPIYATAEQGRAAKAVPRKGGRMFQHAPGRHQ